MGTISQDVRRPALPMQNSLGKFENITIGTKRCGNLSPGVVAGVNTDAEIANKFRDGWGNLCNRRRDDTLQHTEESIALFCFYCRRFIKISDVQRIINMLKY